MTYPGLFSYWAIPLFSAVVWIAMLLTMLIYWLATGRPQYPSMQDGQTIAYISDVGAQTLKPLFIAMGTTSVVSLDLAFVSERWLRHRGRLTRNTATSQKILSGFAIGFALLGAMGLISLTILDTVHHHNLHDLFLGFFM
jgi:Frag1/DRAM/Sfk1 family